MKLIRFAVWMAVVCALVLSSGGCLPRETNPPTKEPAESGEFQEPVEEEVGLLPGHFFPLTLGSRWEYVGEGNEYASFTREVVFVEGDRAQTREDNGGTVLAAVYEVSEDAVTRIFLQGEVYDDVNLISREPSERTAILKGPLEVGATWEDVNGNRKIVSTTASVNTPLGTFGDCIQVEISTAYSTVYEYFREGVGMVKREFISEDARITSTLSDFSIAH